MDSCKSLVRWMCAHRGSGEVGDRIDIACAALHRHPHFGEVGTARRLTNLVSPKTIIYYNGQPHLFHVKQGHVDRVSHV